MSWEAVNWASRQKLKKSYEQIVLLVLANCADPNGEAFVKWPGRDHWWMYLSERTRLPKSSLFRHLNTLVALGLGERTMQVMADGSRRPTFKLDMASSFDIDLSEDQDRYIAATAKGSHESQSPRETDHDEAFEGDENDNDNSHSQEPTSADEIQSPVGTGNAAAQSPVGTDPFPVLRLQEDSLLVPKDSPLPPSGGPCVPDQLWEEFVKAWGEPIPKMALARSAWDHVETARRPEAVASAKGYWAWLKAHPKPPSAQSAQSFLRDAVGWAQWLRYVPDAAGVAPPIVTGYARGSVEARALINLHVALGADEGFRKIYVRETIAYLKPMTDQIRAFADMPPRNEWVKIDRAGAGAWGHFGRAASAISHLRGFREGDIAPWIFPPSATGKTYTTATGPPAGAMTDDDIDALASEGS